MSGITDRLSAALADRYRIEHELGAGGMATVYLAQDLKHNRKVAVKVLRPELSAILGSERFLQEIEVTANLQHPNILPLYDSGEARVPPLRGAERGPGGEVFLYYVMPYVEGESLRDRLNREKQLAVDDAVEIARAVAAALDFAHQRGVIHRDIKPENILLQAGQALVADFGIALALSAAGGGTRLTETGLSIGTPHYMSPEQASADRELDGRTDVYSLGAMLYEMLAGQALFAAGSAPPPRLPGAPAEEETGAVSPNGEWIAYASDESGPWQVYVRRFMEPGGRWLISTGGAGTPLWTSDAEVVYMDYATRSMVAATLEFGPPVRVVGRTTLFDFESYAYSQGSPMYDVSRDGQTFLVLRQQTTSTDDRPIVVLNWFEEIKRRMSEQGGR